MSLMLALALAATPVASGAVPGAAPGPDLAYSQLADPAQEQAAAGLMGELRCLVCQGQSIADSDVAMAADMRRIVRQRIAAGERPEAVRTWLIERYGSYVTYDPPLTLATAPLWLAPIALLMIGLGVARGSFRRRRLKRERG